MSVVILGGGQLSQMLAQAAHALRVPTTVLTEHPTDPAVQVVTDFVKGSHLDEDSLGRAFTFGDVVTFENEFVDVSLLRKVAARFPHVTFRPSLDAIATLQDKLLQKRLLDQLKIPTSPWVLVSDGCAPAQDDILLSALRQWPSGSVFKWARLGYDGKGTWICPPFADETTARKFLPQLSDFLKVALAKGVPVFAERRVDFQCEVAMVAASDTQQSFAAYPLVISQQHQGICHKVEGPATALGLSHLAESEARLALQAIASKLQYVGVFAVEFFYSETGGLLVNEIAPRVHNTGHYTQEASDVSQFANHMRAVSGERVHSPQCVPFFLMTNLLGPDGIICEAREPRFGEPPVGVTPHWYGKLELKPGRKVGHVNAVAQSLEEFEIVRRETQKFVDAWVKTWQGS